MEPPCWNDYADRRGIGARRCDLELRHPETLHAARGGSASATVRFWNLAAHPRDDVGAGDESFPTVFRQWNPAPRQLDGECDYADLSGGLHHHRDNPVLKGLRGVP